MHTLLRFTVLGIFVAAGIGIAISVAAHVEPASTPADEQITFAGTQPSPPIKELPSTDSSAEKHKSSMPKTVFPERLDDNVVAQPAPYRDPVAEQINFFQRRLNQIEQTATSKQIDFLEQRLGQVEQTATTKQIDFQRRLSQFEQTATTNRLAQLEAIVKELNTSRTQPELEPSAPSGRELENPDELTKQDKKGEPPSSSITKGEGDDKLTLDVRDLDLRLLLNYLSREGDLNILASENVKGKITARLTNVDLETALDAILNSTGFVARRQDGLIYVGTPADMDRMDELQNKIETRIYHLNYVTSVELQKLIAPLLSRSGVVTISSAADVDIIASTTQTGGDSFAGNETVIVRDYEFVLTRIDALIVEVDKRPRQIAIEAMILSVNLNHDFRHGIDFEFLQRQQNVRLVSGSPLASLGQIDVSEGGIKFGFLDGNIASFIDALESVGDTNVIAAPHLVCLNRQRAEIQIGDQKGFLSTTQTETATTQQVEFLDVGTLLRIRPFISDDGMIRLEVHPELSTGEIKLIGGFALPEKSVTQVTTNVLVRDGRTVVIGGLIREDLSETRTQVPILGNIPLIGHFFRRKVDTISRNEIIVLITPRIIEDPGEFGEEQQPVISDFQRRQSPMQVHKMTKIAKRHYGRRYYYMARTAWHAGSVETSLRFLDLSLQFYPHHKDAHNLRERILSGDYQNSVDHETLPPQDEPSPQPALEKPSAAQPLKNQLELINANYLHERILSGDSQQTLPPQGAPSPPRAFENWSAAPLLRNQLEFGSLPSNTRSVDTERIYRDWVKSEPLFEGPPRPPIQELP